MSIERITHQNVLSLLQRQRVRGTLTVVRLPLSSTISSGFPASLRTRPWTGRRSGRDAAQGFSRCSTPPDPLNHIHNRRQGLDGRWFGETEPLRRSRCCLLLVFDGRSDVEMSIPRSQAAVLQLLMLTQPCRPSTRRWSDIDGRKARVSWG